VPLVYQSLRLCLVAVGVGSSVGLRDADSPGAISVSASSCRSFDLTSGSFGDGEGQV
jgi:hypothetical protein